MNDIPSWEGNWPPLHLEGDCGCREKTEPRFTEDPPNNDGTWQKFSLIVVSPQGTIVDVYPYWVRCCPDATKCTFTYPHLYRTKDGNIVLEFGCECPEAAAPVTP